jgi:hypothetical protein
MLKINAVYIIEWLRPSDKRAGWELFRELERLAPPVVSVMYWVVWTKDEFRIGASSQYPRTDGQARPQ